MTNLLESPDISSRGGLLNICKPPGLTSFQVVRTVREILCLKRVGHCGTLDPMASGVLLVLYGPATSESNAFMSGEKTYLADMRLGVRTDSGDSTGKVKEIVSVKPPSVAEVEKALKRCTGSLSQIPPMYSAVRWKGRKLYDYARQGIEVPRASRTVVIHSLELLALKGLEIRFRIVCSKGTYVRSLVEDIGACLGVPATLTGLVRERSGEFDVEDSISWDDLRRMSRADLHSKSLLPGTG